MFSQEKDKLKNATLQFSTNFVRKLKVIIVRDALNRAGEATFASSRELFGSLIM